MSYPGDILIKGGQFIRLVPVSLTASTKIISSFGTKIDFNVVDAEKPKFTNPSQKTEYISKSLTGGDTIKHPKNDAAYMASDGSIASKSDNPNQINFSASASYADAKTLVSIMEDNDMRIAVCISAGRRASDETIVGYYHNLGKLVGDIELDFKEDIIPISLTVEGGEVFTAASGVDVSAYNTAMSGSINLLKTGSTETIPALVETSGDLQFSRLLSGKIVADDA